MIGYIYITTNLINGKKYIGQHCSLDLNDNYLGSGKSFLKALNKYGKENFVKEILCVCDSNDELDSMEKLYIDKYNAVYDDNFYNIQFGGKTSSSLGLIYMHNEITNDNILVCENKIDEYLKNGYILGMRKRTDKQKENISKGKKNKVCMNNSSSIIYVDKSKVDDYLKIGYKIGRGTPTRVNEKDEHRKWMNKDGVSIMVKEIDIESYIENGYSFGRVKFSKYNRKKPAWNKGLTKETSNSVKKVWETRREKLNTN